MRRFGVALAMVLALGLAQTVPAAAGNEWCSQDPVVQLLGSQFHVTTSVAAEASAVETIAYRIVVPSNATDAVAHFSQGRRLPSSVEFVPGPDAYDGTSGWFQVSVEVVVTGPADAGVIVDVKGRSVSPASYSGQTGQTISFVLNVAAK